MDPTKIRCSSKRATRKSFSIHLDPSISDQGIRVCCYNNPIAYTADNRPMCGFHLEEVEA
jgi:hypothetical protein